MKLKQKHNLTILDIGEELQIFDQVGDSIRAKPKISKILTDIYIPADTELFYYINWNDRSVNRNITLHLDEPGAHAEIIGIFTASKSNEVKLKSTIAHHAPNTTGNCLIKGVLNDQAQASLSGMIQIDHRANNSYDQLTERLLILSPDAVGQLQPELEILTNDVKASHATTISRPDTEQLFYLQSRGMSNHSSQELLVQGFLEEVYTLMPFEK